MPKDITIHIENFGPIREPAQITLRPFMIFSGVSGTGKSYVAMLVHFVYRVLCGEELISFFTEITGGKSILIPGAITGDNGKVYSVGKYEFSEWVDRRAVSYMQEMLGNQEFSAKIHIEFPDLKDTFEYNYREGRLSMGDDNSDQQQMGFLSLSGVEDSLKFPVEILSDVGVIPFSLLLSRYLRDLYELQPSMTLFLPPSRGALISLPDDARGILSKSGGMYQEFVTDMQELKRLRPRRDEKVSEACHIVQEDVLKGSIDVVDNELYYNTGSLPTPLPITAAASSIKEVAPFALLMQKGWLPYVSTLFEEPESHLHPHLQMKVADILGFAVAEGARIQITTHSDYLLRRISDLIRLSLLADQYNDKEKFIDFCRKYSFYPEAAIKPEDVAAYFHAYDKVAASVVVKRQDVSRGIPFDTFEGVVENEMNNSFILMDETDVF